MNLFRRLFRHRKNFALLLSLVGVPLAVLVYLGLFADLPPSDALITRSSPDATKIYDRNGKLLFEVLDPRAGRRTRVPLSELPVNFRNAVVAVEDGNFYQHPGIDVAGVARAMIQFMREGHIVSGGSTITQQLARELLLSQEERESRSVTRKLREIILAVRLTRAYSKDTILEMYLNEVYFGQLAYGAEAAARTYFGKPARDLDLAEAALLAGMIQSPYAYNPLVNFDAARVRQSIVLDLMAKRRFISDDQAQSARNEPLHLVADTSVTTPLRAPHFVTYVRNLLEAQYGAETVNHGGLSVVTTLDLDLQERAEAIVHHDLAELARRTREEGAPDHNLHDATLVALDPATGEILAMVGSADYFDPSIDGAVNVALANRQPGSAIKPITYATAFERSGRETRPYTPATVLSDVPTTFLTKEHQPYEPQNYDQAWYGPISLRRALATSSNMIAVKVLDHVGLDAMIATAKRLGITTFNDSDRFGLALTLGGGEVKLLELTAAYAAFANNGQRVNPVAILSVNGEARQAGTPSSAVSPQVAYLITNILSDDAARIPAFGEGSVLELSRPAAAKTGTTTDFRDNWTVGYTPDLAVGVWAGNATNEQMYQISGITGAAPIWHDFMEEALRGRPVNDFLRPEGLVDVEICDTSGLLSTPYCPRRRTELFIAGTEPTREDDSYQPIAIDSATNLLWVDGPVLSGVEGCQGARIERVFRLLPPDAQDWGRKQGIPAPPDENCLGQVAGLRIQDTGPKSQVVGTTSQASSCNLGLGACDLLVITSPAPNSIFELSPQLPQELQQIDISARLGTSVALREVTFLLDGQPLATFNRAPYRALWRLSLGEHQVQAVGVDANGQRVESETIQFTVTGGQ